MNEREVHIALSQNEPIRFQDYGIDIFHSLSTKSSLKKAIKKGLITINGLPANTATYINGGEQIVLYEVEENFKKTTFELTLEVVYEDDFLAVINKPPGILVSGNKLRTIVNALRSNINKSTLPDSLTSPLPVHRLDFPTSGLLIIAKTNKTLISLGNMFEAKEISKTYHAITTGKMEESGVVETEIDGKKSRTSYEVIETQSSNNYKHLNLIRLYPETGRRHQLRIHLSSLGNPILGDNTYGVEGAILKGKGLFLCATGLSFEHPISKDKISLDIEIPTKFRKLFPLKI